MNKTINVLIRFSEVGCEGSWNLRWAGVHLKGKESVILDKRDCHGVPVKSGIDRILMNMLNVHIIMTIPQQSIHRAR